MNATSASESLFRAGALLRHGDRVLLALGDLDQWALTSSGISIPVTGIAGSRECDETMAERARIVVRERTGAEAVLQHSSVTFVDSEGELTRKRFAAPMAPLLYQVRHPRPEVLLHVGVYLAQPTKAPRPGNVPGLLWAPLSSIGRLIDGVTYRELRAMNVELLANEQIPDEAEFQLDALSAEQLIPRIVSEFGAAALGLPGARRNRRCGGAAPQDMPPRR